MVELQGISWNTLMDEITRWRGILQGMFERTRGMA